MSSTVGNVGFLQEQCRSNKAVTRARRHLCVIGDSVTVNHEPFIKGLIEHCHSVKEVWSSHEYLHGRFMCLYVYVYIFMHLMVRVVHLHDCMYCIFFSLPTLYAQTHIHAHAHKRVHTYEHTHKHKHLFK